MWNLIPWEDRSAITVSSTFPDGWSEEGEESARRPASRPALTMKRFFQPVAKEGSSKKPALSGQSGEEQGGGGREGSAAPGEEGEKRGPLRFLTWNANSLLLRVKNDWPEFSKFVQELDPDAICVQVRPHLPHVVGISLPPSPPPLSLSLSLWFGLYSQL